MLATLDFGSFKLLCAVAHGPHRGHKTEHIQAWWNDFQLLCKKHRHVGPLVVFIDANAGVGSSPPHFGDLHSQTCDAAGKCMLTFCRELHLCAPSTFVETHSGDSATWHSHKLNCTGSRNDYILVSLKISHHWGSTWVDRFLDSGHARLDHSALLATFWCPLPKARRKAHLPSFDRDKILAADDDTWTRFFSSWKDIPWSTDVDTHALQLERQIIDKLGEFFPRESKRKRQSLFSDDTWTLYHQKAQLRRLITSCPKMVDLWQLCIGFSALKGIPIISPRLKLFGLCLRACSRLRLFNVLSHNLRTFVREDKAKVADSLLVPLQQANGKQAIRLLKPLRLGKRHRDMGQKAMPAVRFTNGELAQTPAEALQRWREHFGQLEGGQVTTSTDLWHTVASSRLRRPTCFPGLSDIPTLLELEDQLRKVKAGKAVGPDLVPGEFLKAAGPWIARELWPLLFKICCRVQEPLMYKGGRLATLFKHKGSATEATNHRAILISSTVGKTIHGVFRDRTVPYVRKGASELQFSAHQGALVSIAAHMVRLHQNWSKVSHRCDFTIFVDIASAYYTLLRQLTTEVEMTDENILALLARLGYKDCHIDAVVRKLEEPTAMESLEVPPHLRAILGEFHSHTWFRLRSDPALVSTGRGTRPGDGLADILWSLSFSNFLHLTEERIQSLNLHKPLRWNNRCSPHHRGLYNLGRRPGLCWHVFRPE